MSEDTQAPGAREEDYSPTGAAAATEQSAGPTPESQQVAAEQPNANQTSDAAAANSSTQAEAPAPADAPGGFDAGNVGPAVSEEDALAERRAAHEAATVQNAGDGVSFPGLDEATNEPA